MTNPIQHSVFTVEVNFKGIFYDVEITPTFNNQPIPWLQDRVVLWTSAETKHQLFSKKIEEMLANTDFPANYSLDTHGLITAGSAEGFTFDKGSEITHKTQAVWQEFLECLRDPVTQSHIAGDPIDEDDEVEGTNLGTRMKFTPNVYRNLSADEQKAVRVSLFQKKCYEHFASANKVDIPEGTEEYTPAEKAYLVYYRNPWLRKETPGKEGLEIGLRQPEEIRQMAPHVDRIRKEMKQAALRRQQAVLVEPDDESLNSYDTANESNDDVFYDTANDSDSSDSEELL